MAFELDSPERESGEGSTTPCGVKGVVGPVSRAQIRLAVEKTGCPLQRTTAHSYCSYRRLQGVWSVAECIVALERDIGMVSNFQIIRSIPLSDLRQGHSSFELHGQSLRKV